MALVEAYDPTTGNKLDYLVPEHHIDHPVLGRRLRRLPSNGKAPTEPDAPTAEPGSVDEAHQLKGAALDDALDAAELQKTGAADEKRQRLAEHRTATHVVTVTEPGSVDDIHPVPTDSANGDLTEIPPAGKNQE